MLRNSLWGTVILLLIAECACGEHLKTESQLTQKSTIEFCPKDIEEEAKNLLGIDSVQQIGMRSLIDKLVARGYDPYYEKYIVYDKHCWDSTLSGSQQLFVTVGLGKNKNGNEVFRAFVLIPDKDGNLRKIEARYSYW